MILNGWIGTMTASFYKEVEVLMRLIPVGLQWLIQMLELVRAWRWEKYLKIGKLNGFILSLLSGSNTSVIVIENNSNNRKTMHVFINCIILSILCILYFN